MSSKIALIGDSIFDNDSYVQPGCAVIDHLRKQLFHGEIATLYARDGAVCSSIQNQIPGISSCDYLVMSIGGNDALRWSGIVNENVSNVGEALSKLTVMRQDFLIEYKSALKKAIKFSSHGKLFICTIYDCIPGLSSELKTALAIFNEIILYFSSLYKIPMIDLRVVCSEEKCYSKISLIEPSEYGGQKIADAIIAAILESEK